MALGKGLNSLLPQNKERKMIHKETGSQNDSSRIWHIPLTEITPNERQPRKVFSHQELEDLVASIKKHGVLQPITVTEKNDGGYELIAGERRWRSSQIAGLATIPAIVRTANAQEKLELALIENIQRQDLNPIEEAFAYKRLMEEFNLTQQSVSEQVGKSRSVVANTVRLLDLPEVVQKALSDGKLSAGKARALLSLSDPDEQLKMFKSMIGEEATTVRDFEKAVAKKGEASRKGSPRKDPNLLAQEEMLEGRFGSKVNITQRGEKGAITIHYSSKDELKRLLQELS